MKVGEFMGTNTILNKVSIVNRCIIRVKEDYENNPDNLKNFTKQDAIILNLQRACEACIDLGMHICAKKKLGLPQASKDVFSLISQGNLISDEIAKKMQKMVGFRNIAVHNYQGLNIAILQSIIENHLQDFTDYTELILKIKELQNNDT